MNTPDIVDTSASTHTMGPVGGLRRRAADWTPWKITPYGIEFERDLTEDEFKELGYKIGNLANGLQWAIGDWLAYGNGRGEFGESFELAAVLTGKSHESLSQAYRVSLAFPMDRRIRERPWTWHRIALSLPEAKQLPMLQRAAAESWTRMQFIGHVTQANKKAVQRALKAGKPLTTNQLKSSEWRRVKRDAVQCPDCGHRFQVGRDADVDRTKETPS